MNRFIAWILLVGALVMACGVSVPPSGGPEDKTAPTVTGSVPARDSAGVDPAAEIRLTFSEDMTRKGIERLIEFSPPAEVKSVDWDGRTAVVRTLDPLHPDTTYLVTVKPGVRDNHGVTQKGEFTFAFATSAAIDSGSIAGRVLFRREPTDKGVVRLFALPADSGFSPQASRADREARTGADGSYELPYLASGNVAYAVWAFHDADGNGVFDPEKEVGWARADTVVLTPMVARLTSRDIFIVDPKEPGSITGRVANETGIDSVLVSVALFAPNDTTPPAYYTRCDTTGAFTFKPVLMGTYAVRAFVDLRPDSLCGNYPCPDDSAAACVEPCAGYPDSVTVAPGESVELEAFTLGRRATERGGGDGN